MKAYCLMRRCETSTDVVSYYFSSKELLNVAKEILENRGQEVYSWTSPVRGVPDYVVDAFFTEGTTIYRSIGYNEILRIVADHFHADVKNLKISGVSNPSEFCIEIWTGEDK